MDLDALRGWDMGDNGVPEGSLVGSGPQSIDIASNKKRSETLPKVIMSECM